MTKELASHLRGWKSYFGFSQTPSGFRNLDPWRRRRLRRVGRNYQLLRISFQPELKPQFRGGPARQSGMIWKQWKRGQVRFAKLCALGVSKDLAAKTAGSAHGPWHIANSPAFPIACFDALGVPRLSTCP